MDLKEGCKELWYPEGYPGKRSLVLRLSSCIVMSVTWHFHAPRTEWQKHLSLLKATNLSVFDRVLPCPMPLSLVKRVCSWQVPGISIITTTTICCSASDSSVIKSDHQSKVGCEGRFWNFDCLVSSCFYSESYVIDFDINSVIRIFPKM